MSNFDSIIFDLDGTIWDTLDIVTETWNEALKIYGLNKTMTTDAIQSVTGLPYDDLVKKLLPDLDQNLQREITEKTGELQFDYLRQHGGKLYDHVEETLAKLSQRYKLAIVSNCEKEYMEAFFEYHHELQPYFVDFENPGRTGLTKSENIKLVMERSAFEHPVYVGDTLGDQQAAKGADIPFVYATYGFGTADQFDYQLDQFDQLLNLF